MIVGVLRLRLHIPQSRSLKAKRQVLRRITERIRNDHHCSVSEVAEQDSWSTATLGVCTVGGDAVTVRTALDRAAEAVERMHLAAVLDRDTDVLGFKDGEPLRRGPM